MKKELDSNIIAEGLKLQADLLIKLNDENSKMNNAASKKKHRAGINKKGRTVLFAFLRDKASSETLSKCAIALDRAKLSSSKLSSQKEDELLGWLTPVASTTSNKLRKELLRLENLLSTKQIESGRKRGESRDGSFTTYMHGSMTWYYIGNGIKWLVDQKTKNSEFNLEDGALQVYEEYTAHIQLKGECHDCNKAYHATPTRIVGHLTDPLHIAVAQTCALKVLIKYCDGDMTVAGFIPVDNTPVEQYYATVELYLRQVSIGTGRWNFICGIAELRHQAGKLRKLAKSDDKEVRELCARFGILEDYDWLSTLLVSIGVPLDETALKKRHTANVARDLHSKKQATEQGKKVRKQQKMRNRVDDRTRKLRIAAEAKAASTAEFAELLEKDVASAFEGRQYGDGDEDDETAILMIALMSMEMAAPTQAKNAKELKKKIASAKQNTAKNAKNAKNEKDKKDKKDKKEEIEKEQKQEQKQKTKNNLTRNDSSASSSAETAKRPPPSKKNKTPSKKRKARTRASKPLNELSRTDAYKRIISMLFRQLIARDGLCLYRTLSVVAPILNSSLAQSLTNRDVLEMCRLAVAACGRQPDSEVWINHGKVFDQVELSTEQAAIKMYKFFQVSAFRGTFTATSSLTMPDAKIWGSNCTLTNTVRRRVVLDQYKIKNPIIVCAAARVSRTKKLSQHHFISSMYLSSGNAAYGFGAETVRIGEASAIKPGDIERNTSRYTMTIVEALQICAHYCPLEPPRIATLCTGPHYEVYMMAVANWKLCVKYLNQLDGLKGSKAQIKWKHIYNKVYESGWEVSQAVPKSKSKAKSKKKNKVGKRRSKRNKR